MTVSHRKNKAAPAANDKTAAEPGVRYHCDACGADITLTVRLRCAECEDFDLCGSCFCEGSTTGTHKPWHDYRVVEQHAYPIFSSDWGADEELLLIDGAQIYGLGNWADIADHIGNRTKEDVEAHYVAVYIEGRDGTEAGDRRAEAVIRAAEEEAKHSGGRVRPPPVGPNMEFNCHIDAEEFQQRKRRRIEDLRETQKLQNLSLSSSAATGGKPPAPPKPLVSAPTSHSELAGFMPGRLEFETEYEQEAENLTKDMEFGKVYVFGGDKLAGEMEALGGAAAAASAAAQQAGAAAQRRAGPTSSRMGGGMGVKRKDKAEKGGEKEKGKEGEDETQVEKDEDEEEEEAAAAAAAKEEEDEAEEEAEQDEDADASMAEHNDGASSKTGTPAPAAAAAATTSGEATAAPDAAADAAAAAAAALPQADPEDRAADWDEDPQDLDLKLTVLEMYNERLDRRGRRKHFIFERNLVDYKRNQAAERKRPKEEREILSRVRHFAQMQTAQDFEGFLNGLCHEEALRRAAAQLQRYRKAGITTLAEAARYDAEASERAKRAALIAEGGMAAFPTVGAAQSRQAVRPRARETSTAEPASFVEASASAAAAAAAPFKPSADGKIPRKPPKPLDLSQHPSLHLLTAAEAQLCSAQRIQPSAYLVMKKEIIAEYLRRNGRMSRRESRQLFKMDVNKVGKVFDLIESEGYLVASPQTGTTGKGKSNGA